MNKAAILIVSGAIIAFGLFFFFKSRESRDGGKTTEDEFLLLVEFAQSRKSLRELLIYASKSKYTEVTIEPPKPADLKDMNAEGMPSDEWLKWLFENSKTISLTEMHEVSKVLDRIQKGYVTLADPKDTPLKYDRRFLRLEFENDTITKVNSRSL